MNGLDRSPKELNGDIKPKKEPRSTPSSESSSQNGAPPNGTLHKPTAVKEVSGDNSFA